MTDAKPTHDILDSLNPEQRKAAAHGDLPLLIIAGAGTGKTQTLVHRVAHLIDEGAEPGRILLLTFTRRASAEMLRRVDAILRKMGRHKSGRQRFSRNVWGGTFHAVATRLLRIHGKSVGLPTDFTIHDRSDSEDLLNVIRTELEFPKFHKRFPKKGTCMAIYSHCVNSRQPLKQILSRHFTWCEEYEPQLKRLFGAYVDRKDKSAVLDYDDLLLFWHGLMADSAGDQVRSRFDHVLVDEYQDTNFLQSEILKMLRPDGSGLTVVGDDAQSIYSFRAASVRNILEFPDDYSGAQVVTLEQNYRSTQPILQTTNLVIAQAQQRHTKNLWSQREPGDKPQLINCSDEFEQADEVVRQVLEHREEGIDLKRQAVLFRASHHSIFLEGELTRHNIPFVKYGGLKFTETAHVKDLMAYLRLAENPRDLVSGSRLLMLLPGIGPKTAYKLVTHLIQADGNFQCWVESNVPGAAGEHWPKMVRLMLQLTGPEQAKLPAQVHNVLEFYTPLMEEVYDNPDSRLRDLEQVEQMSARFADRQSMLTSIALDPPTTTEDYADNPHLDEDYLILSTIHSAKGLEWDAVYLIHAADGNIPSDMALKDTEQLEEERRLLYVALTRAKSWLYVYFPLVYYQGHRGPRRDQFGYVKLSRFLTDQVQQSFVCRTVESDGWHNDWDDDRPASIRQSIRRSSQLNW